MFSISIRKTDTAEHAIEIMNGALVPSIGARTAVITGMPRDEIVEYRFMRPVLFPCFFLSVSALLIPMNNGWSAVMPEYQVF